MQVNLTLMIKTVIARTSRQHSRFSSESFLLKKKKVSFIRERERARISWGERQKENHIPPLGRESDVELDHNTLGS